MRPTAQINELIGGPGEDRTPDPMVANQITAVIENY
jgi:hypothetical protein